jgi:hypothetical protein
MLIPAPVRYRTKGAQKPVLGKEGEKDVEAMHTKRMRREAIVLERGKRRENNEKKRRANEGGRGEGRERERREKLTLKRLFRDPAKGKSGVLLRTNKSHSVHVCALCSVHSCRTDSDGLACKSVVACEAQPPVKERKQIFGLLCEC